MPAEAPLAPPRAVLIGVARYPSLGDDAPGAENDAVAWFGIATAVGYAPDTIRVLRSPAATLDDFPAQADRPHASQLGGATREEIVAAVRALVAELRANPDARGLLTYAGHGASANGDLLLCPEDTVAGITGYANTLSGAELCGIIGDRPLPNLTVVLDCCFAGRAAPPLDGSPAAPTRSLTPGGGSVASAHADLAARCVVLSACGPDQEAYAYSLRPNLTRKPVMHGVLTTAVSAILQRWSPPGVEQPEPYPIRYRTLAARARRYTSALAFDQQPQVSGPKGTLNRHAFFDHRGDTLTTPPAIPGRELSGGNQDFWSGNITLNAAYKGFYLANGTSGGQGLTRTAYSAEALPQGWSVAAATSLVASSAYGAVASVSPTPGATWGSAALFDLRSSDGNNTFLGFALVAPSGSTSGGMVWCWASPASAFPASFQMQAGTLSAIQSTTPTYPFCSGQKTDGTWGSSKVPLGATPAGNTRFYIQKSDGTFVGAMELTMDGAMIWTNFASSAPIGIPSGSYLKFSKNPPNPPTQGYQLTDSRY